MKLIHAIAETFRAYMGCKARIDADRKDAVAQEWYTKHYERLAALTAHLPKGSGINDGPYQCGMVYCLDLDHSKPDRLIFYVDFHHMSDNGYYDGYTSHRIVAVPTLDSQGYELRIGGRDRNDIKEYLAQGFYDALSSEVPASV